MRVKINVTKKCIEDGTSSAQTCPVNLAIQKKLLKKTRAYTLVTYSQVYPALYTGEAGTTIRHQQKVVDFIKKFDYAGKNAVKPFTFVANIPKKYLKPSVKG